MAINRGKQWEKKFQEDWERTMTDSVLIRLPDQVSQFAGYSSNICDFIGFKTPRLFLIECKTTHKNTFSLTDFRQYDKLIQYKNLSGVHAGVLLWWVTNEVVAWISIESIEKMKQDNKKSINIKMIEEKSV